MSGEDRAFPKLKDWQGNLSLEGGMSLRAYIATAALQGLLAGGSPPQINGVRMTVDHAAVVLADALLMELNKPTDKKETTR